MKKQAQPESLAFEIYQEQRNKLRISLAVNAVLVIAAILATLSGKH